MPLLFNDKPVDEATIKSIIADRLPSGKDKTVVFTLCSPKIMIRRTEKGREHIRPGGVRPISTGTLATIGGVEGILTYYTFKNPIKTKDGIDFDYEPKYFYFRNHEMNFNAATDLPRLAFHLLDRRNEPNAKEAGRLPLYRMMDTGATSKKTVNAVTLKLEAYDLVREAFKSNKPKLKSLYQALGYSNFNELKAAQEWDSVLSPIYAKCESDPAKIVELMKNAALDTGAKITQATEIGILKADSQGYYWTKGGKKIFAIPAGRGEDGLDLFVNFLRNEDKSGVLALITKELDVAEVQAAIT